MTEQHVLDSFNSQGLMRHLGVKMESASDGRCVLEVGFAPTHTQQRGYFHAGVTSAIADTAAGYAAISLISREHDVLTIEFKINLVNPAAGNRLRAEAEVIKRGRTIMVTRAVVYGVRGDEKTPCAEFLGTMFVVEKREPV